MEPKLFMFAVDLNSFSTYKSEVKCLEGNSPWQEKGYGIEISFILGVPQSPDHVKNVLLQIINDLQWNMQDLAEGIFQENKIEKDPKTILKVVYNYLLN